MMLPVMQLINSVQLLVPWFALTSELLLLLFLSSKVKDSIEF